MSLRLPALAFVSLILLAAGCGGSDPSETVRAYLLAVVEQDGQKACDQFTDSLRSDIEESPAAVSSGRSCADVMGLAAGLNPGLSESDVEDVEIEVEENGNEAVATLVNPLVRSEETIDLVEEGGEWRISTLETRPTG